MKAIVSCPNDGLPHVVYWTGQVLLHVGAITYCNEEIKVKTGVLQVPDDVETCKRCNDAIANHRYPKPRKT